MDLEYDDSAGECCNECGDLLEKDDTECASCSTPRGKGLDDEG